MTPFRATADEFVQRFLTTSQRQTLLGKWLSHREALRKIGVTDGTQWLNGSFVEDKVPNDIDVVTFFHRPKDPNGLPLNSLSMSAFMQINSPLFNRPEVKSAYSLDAFFIDLDASARSLVNLTRYYCGLFSHQRTTDLWKGMLEIDLFDLNEASAVKSVQGWIAP